MEPHKIAVKFYAAEGSDLTDADFVPVLHTWVQNHVMPDHILVDVADYSHVKDGPGTVLVAHEANVYLDRMDGQLGLTYARKQPVPDALSFYERLAQAFGAALAACARLEDDPKLAGQIKFRTDEAAVFINDRLLAPNTPGTFENVRGDLERFAAMLYEGCGIDIEHYASQLQLFEVHIRATDAPDSKTLLNRLGVSVG